MTYTPPADNFHALWYILDASGKPTFYFIVLYHAFSCFSVKTREKYNKSNPPYFSECLGIWLKK